MRPTLASSARTSGEQLGPEHGRHPIVAHDDRDRRPEGPRASAPEWPVTTGATSRSVRATVASPARSSSTHRMASICRPSERVSQPANGARKAASKQSRLTVPGAGDMSGAEQRMPKKAQAREAKAAVAAADRGGGRALRSGDGRRCRLDRLPRDQRQPPAGRQAAAVPAARSRRRVYAADGTLLGEFYTEKRYLVPIAKIPAGRPRRRSSPPRTPASTGTAASTSSASHGRRSANFTAGSVVQGGSTITQQVVKALLLTPRRATSGRLKEILLSLRLERQLTKDEILYLYLNLIYLGNGAYGVGAAAQEYFGKDVADLDLAEASLLAGLPRAPSRYSPVKHWDRAKYRQRYVLERMARERFVTWEAERAGAAGGDPAHPSRRAARRRTSLRPTSSSTSAGCSRSATAAPRRYQAGSERLHDRRSADPAGRRASPALEPRRDRHGTDTGTRRSAGSPPARRRASSRAAKRRRAIPTSPSRDAPARRSSSHRQAACACRSIASPASWSPRKDHPLPAGLGKNDVIAVRRHPIETGAPRARARQRPTARRRAHLGRPDQWSREGAGRRLRLRAEPVQSRDAGAPAARLVVQAVHLFGGDGPRLDTGVDRRRRADRARRRRPGLDAAELRREIHRPDHAPERSRPLAERRHREARAEHGA
mgnify:CR=1 FL=1